MPRIKITPEITSFCYHYLTLGDAREAAARAGVKEPAASLLLNGGVSRELARVSGLLGALPPAAMAGLGRLAYGSVNDAARLLYLEDDEALRQLDTLDLFAVSELKRVKGGGLEIKFHDRQKALEALLERDSRREEAGDARSLMHALNESAKALAYEDRALASESPETGGDGGAV
jgi:hypothetical protein